MQVTIIIVMGGLGYVSGVPFFTPFLIPISTFLPCKSSNANLPTKQAVSLAELIRKELARPGVDLGLPGLPTS